MDIFWNYTIYKHTHKSDKTNGINRKKAVENVLFLSKKVISVTLKIEVT